MHLTFFVLLFGVILLSVLGHTITYAQPSEGSQNANAEDLTGVFVDTGNKLSIPGDMVFAKNGHIFITSTDNNVVMEYSDYDYRSP